MVVGGGWWLAVAGGWWAVVGGGRWMVRRSDARILRGGFNRKSEVVGSPRRPQLRVGKKRVWENFASTCRNRHATP